jgi:hypothetical protein
MARLNTSADGRPLRPPLRRLGAGGRGLLDTYLERSVGGVPLEGCAGRALQCAAQIGLLRGRRGSTGFVKSARNVARSACNRPLQRRGRDSNPRWTERPTTVFEPSTFRLRSQSEPSPAAEGTSGRQNWSLPSQPLHLMLQSCPESPSGLSSSCPRAALRRRRARRRYSELVRRTQADSGNGPGSATAAASSNRDAGLGFGSASNPFWHRRTKGLAARGRARVLLAHRLKKLPSERPANEWSRCAPARATRAASAGRPPPSARP